MSSSAKVYILHGWTYDISPWEPVIAHLKKQGVTAEILKVPGLATPSKKIWTVEAYADWANQNLPDGAIALGHSNGGRILMNLLVKHPAKLSGLILLDSAGVYEPSAKRTILRVVAKIFAPLKHIAPLRKLFHRVLGASDYDRAPANMKKTLHNMISSDKHLDPSTISVPTRIIWGDADTITPLRQGRRLHATIKHSKIIIKKGWPHSPYLKTPEALADTIAAATKDLARL